MGRVVAYAAGLALAYGAVAALYIQLSGELAAQLAGSVERLQQVERFKGFAFVCVTSALLFLLAWWAFARFERLLNERAHDRASRVLLQRQGLAGQLAATVAHDFRNVLAVVRTSLDLLDELEHPVQREAIVDAEQAVARGAALAERLMRTARGALEASVERCAFDALLTDTIKLLSRHPKLQRCTIRIQLQPQLVGLFDRTMVEQLLANLLLNAADAVGGKGTIVVTAEGSDDRVELRVEDDGPGLPERLGEQVLDAFVTTKQDGFGLGLLSAHAAVKAHGGELRLGRSALGGACFTASLRLER